MNFNFFHGYLPGTFKTALEQCQKIKAKIKI